MSVQILCKNCGKKFPPDEAKGCATPYHDMRCPECGTSNLDTSELNKDWANRGEKYGYGDDNCLINSLSGQAARRGRGREMQELNQRVHDLVRFMRTELHNEGLITDEEYVSLAGDNGALQRLEDYDAVIQKAKEAAASKRPSGLVSVLISEIVQLNELIVDWKHEFLMYRNAWMREIGGLTVWKHHEIDSFVLSTRAAFTRKAKPVENDPEEVRP